MLLFFGACDKWSSNVDTTSHERQVNGEDQISHCNNKDFVLWLCAHSTAGQIAGKYINILQILSDLPVY
jgi:hypothetical protein